MLICESDACIKKTADLVHDGEFKDTRAYAWLAGLHFISRPGKDTISYIMVS